MRSVVTVRSPNLDRTMVANVLDAHRQITFPLKCVGLHPLVTEGRNRRQLHYRMLNCALILASIGFYGYLLWNYSLDSEFFRLNSGSIIVHRMLDFFYLARYTMCITVSLFGYYSLERSQRMQEKLEQCSDRLKKLSLYRGDLFGFVSSQRFLRTVQGLSFVVPFVGVLIVNYCLTVGGGTAHIGLLSKIARYVYSCCYVQLWLQPTFVMLLIWKRYAALNRIIR